MCKNWRRAEVKRFWWLQNVSPPPPLPNHSWEVMMQNSWNFQKWLYTPLVQLFYLEGFMYVYRCACVSATVYKHKGVLVCVWDWVSVRFCVRAPSYLRMSGKPTLFKTRRSWGEQVLMLLFCLKALLLRFSLSLPLSLSLSLSLSLFLSLSLSAVFGRVAWYHS